MSDQSDPKIHLPLIDAASAAEIIELLGQPRYLELLGKLVDQVQEKAGVMAEAALQRREAEVKQHLHSLKGAASSLFAARLAQTIESLERSEEMPSALELASLRECARATLKSFVEANSELAEPLSEWAANQTVSR